MATTKLTMEFQMNTVDPQTGLSGRSSGWTESWYFGGEPGPAIAAAKFKNGLCQRRAALLPKTASIIALRAEQVDPLPGAGSITVAVQYPGNPDYSTDLPSVALQEQCNGVGVTNKKVLIIRCIPDVFVQTGEYAPDPGFSNALNFYNITLGGWSFRAQSNANPRVTIVSYVSATGLVTTNAAHGLAINDTVQIYKMVLQSTRQKVSLKTQVVSTPGGLTFTINPPVPLGDCLGGKVKKITVIYPAVDPASVSPIRAITRKTGRPFGRFTGRKSKGKRL